MNARCRTWGQSRGRRLPTSSYEAGFPIHLTICTVDRRATFSTQSLAAAVFKRIEASEATLAACLMPDHLHWLQADAAAHFEEVNRFKSVTTGLAWRFGHQGPLWQRSYSDRVLRRSDDVARVARYIAENPVRAGLVDSLEQYALQCQFAERFPW